MHPSMSTLIHPLSTHSSIHPRAHKSIFQPLSHAPMNPSIHPFIYMSNPVYMNLSIHHPLISTLFSKHISIHHPSIHLSIHHPFIIHPLSTHACIDSPIHTSICQCMYACIFYESIISSVIYPPIYTGICACLNPSSIHP